MQNWSAQWTRCAARTNQKFWQGTAKTRGLARPELHFPEQIPNERRGKAALWPHLAPKMRSGAGTRGHRMRSKIATVVAGVALACVAATASEACSRNVSATAAKTIVPQAGINQPLLDEAIRTEVNFHRCRAGLESVSDANSRLSREAEKHSKWMARTQQLTHKSTVAGASTLKQRVKNSGIRFKTGSENIGMVHRYQIDNRRFKIVDSNACQFRTNDGQPLPAHSYATLARHVVTLWMNSPGHRKNILDRRVRATTAAVAFDPNAQYCGQFWLTQNFIG